MKEVYTDRTFKKTNELVLNLVLGIECFIQSCKCILWLELLFSLELSHIEQIYFDKNLLYFLPL